MNNTICELVGRLAGAPQVFLYQRKAGARMLEVMGQFGFRHETLTLDWHIPAIDAAKSRALIYQDTGSEPSLESHPLLREVPRARSLLVLRLPASDKASEEIMMIVNPDADVLLGPDKITALLLLAQVVAPQVGRSVQLVTPQLGLVAAGPGFHDGDAPRPIVASADQSAAAFLLRTLPKKHRLLARNGVSFTAVRTWRSALKEYQIAALKSIKELPERDDVARTVASEMAEAVTSQLGRNFINHIVPIPGGSSGRSDAFSVRVADEMGKLLGCEMVAALRGNADRGSSHPKKSARLGEYEVTTRLSGATLVVDDVITSGRHMELAVKALREKGVNCFAVGWIAG